MREIRELYRQHYHELYRFFLVRTSSRQRAEELVQETFSQACSSLWRFRSDSSLRTWLYAIARNVLSQSRRRRQRRPVPIDPEIVSSLRKRGGMPVVNFPSPEEQVLRNDRWEQVLTAMAGLPEHYQTVLWLRDGEELPYAEIAVIMERSEGAARVLVYRARRALRRCYQDLIAEGQHRAGSESS